MQVVIVSCQLYFVADLARQECNNLKSHKEFALKLKILYGEHVMPYLMQIMYMAI